MKVRLFVYGTLRAGERAHHHLAGSRLVGPADTEDGYELLDLGDYPALRAAREGRVHGDLYEVEPAVLAALDRYEGHPTLFRRGEVRLADGTTATTYFAHAAGRAGAPRIASGDWRRR